MYYRYLIGASCIYIGLIAFALVAAVSFTHGVEPFVSVLRGIGVFMALLIFQKISLRIYDLLPGLDEAEVIPHKGAE